LKRLNKFRFVRKSVTPVGVADYAYGSIRRNGQPNGPGGFEAYHQLEFRGLHDRQFGPLFTLDYSADVDVAEVPSLIRPRRRQALVLLVEFRGQSISQSSG
jgi:hypothetical protein